MSASTAAKEERFKKAEEAADDAQALLTTVTQVRRRPGVTPSHSLALYPLLRRCRCRCCIVDVAAFVLLTVVVYVCVCVCLCDDCLSGQVLPTAQRLDRIKTTCKSIPSSCFTQRLQCLVEDAERGCVAYVAERSTSAASPALAMVAGCDRALALVTTVSDATRAPCRGARGLFPGAGAMNRHLALLSRAVVTPRARIFD
jgi:hypothetical protein